jgi:hypothetical protein
MNETAIPKTAIPPGYVYGPVFDENVPEGSKTAIPPGYVYGPVFDENVPVPEGWAPADGRQFWCGEKWGWQIMKIPNTWVKLPERKPDVIDSPLCRGMLLLACLIILMSVSAFTASDKAQIDSEIRAEQQYCPYESIK